MPKYMMVLEDTETFSDLDGCMIVEVPDGWDEDSIDVSEHRITMHAGSNGILIDRQFATDKLVFVDTKGDGL